MVRLNLLQLKAKEDPDWEKKVGAWIEAVLGKKLIDVADLHVSLKDGIFLCEYASLHDLRQLISSNFSHDSNFP